MPKDKESGEEMCDVCRKPIPAGAGRYRFNSADGMVVVHTECDGEAVQRRRPPGPRAEIDSPG
jgi:hypothetical protein